MPRIRTLKPEAWRRRRVGERSIEAQLLWVKLITLADDAGRFPADVGTIAGHGYPRQLEVVPQIPVWLEELAEAVLVVLYERDGDPYGVIPKFREHQKINRPSVSRLPEPPLSIHGVHREKDESAPAPLTDDSVSPHGTEVKTPENPGLTEDSVSPQCPDHGPRTTDLGSGISGGGVARDIAPIVSALKSAGFDELTIETYRSGIDHALAEFNPPTDVDWFRVGQQIREKREAGAIRSDRPDSALRFMFRGLSSLPRLQAPGAGVFASTASAEHERLAARFGGDR